MSGDFWAITSYFNPMGYARRLANFRQFRRRLGVPLLVVEATMGGPCSLDGGDADILVRCTGGDVMWQKERLINHGLGELPESCRYVAWIDCDLLFEHPDWAAIAREDLRQGAVVQLFSGLNHAARDALPVPDGVPDPGWMQRGLVSALRDFDSVREALAACMDREPGTPSPGMAWAAPRAWLQVHGLYDNCIVGGGDTAFASALLRQPAAAADLHVMNPAQRRAYAEWAEPVARDSVRVSHVPGTVHHLWHGDMRLRQSRQRHVRLAANGFDPRVDLQHAGGAWQWASDKPALHACVRDYLASRREDE